MPNFSNESKTKLAECHKDLQTLFNEVIKYYDCIVLVGFRNAKDQDDAYAEGKSQVKYPFSKHNTQPSLAADVAPFPLDWQDKESFYHFGGFVIGIAKMLKNSGTILHDIRWGGDWNCNNNLHDQSLYDLVHFEII